MIFVRWPDSGSGFSVIDFCRTPRASVIDFTGSFSGVLKKRQ
jgi:hypothetical protein